MSFFPFFCFFRFPFFFVWLIRQEGSYEFILIKRRYVFRGIPVNDSYFVIKKSKFLFFLSIILTRQTSHGPSKNYNVATVASKSYKE